MAATTTRRKTQSKKADKPKAAEPKVEQIKLADLEAEIVTTLKSEGVQPAAVDKTLLKRWNNVCDEGRLQFYTAPPLRLEAQLRLDQPRRRQAGPEGDRLLGDAT